MCIRDRKKRFEKLEDSRETAWQVTKGDWRRNREFDRYLRINEEMLERTDTDYAPWVIVEAVDRDFAAAKIAESVADRLEAAVSDLQNNRVEQEDREDLSGYRRWDQSGVLSGIDLSKTISQEEYKIRLKKLQKKLGRLHSELYRLRIPVVIGFEGWDAAGKGGAIKRLTSPLDPRGYQVNPTAAPAGAEKVPHLSLIHILVLWNRVRKQPEGYGKQ